MEKPMVWEDQCGKHLPYWHETYETEYKGLPVVLDTFILGNTIYAPEDVLRLKVYKDKLKTDFIGLQAFFINRNGVTFIEAMGKSQQPIPLDRAPNLEDFVDLYRPLFESHEVLQDAFNHML